MAQVYTAIARNALKHDMWRTYALRDDPTCLEAALLHLVSHVVVGQWEPEPCAITTLLVSGVGVEENP